MTTPTDTRHTPLSKVDRLRQDAAAASELRALTTHPDVVALRTERTRTAVDRFLWSGLLLGLAFTMVNVQQFAAQGAPTGSLPWLAAWLLDPMVSLVLIGVLLAEQVTARYQVPTGVWVRHTKRLAFAATYSMNTWQAWTELHPPGILVHSFPPLVVLCVAETGPHLRDRITEAVLAAARTFTANPATTDTPAPGHEPAQQQPAAKPARARRPRSSTRATPSRPARKMLADYLGEARAAYAPGTEVSPAWVRSVTDCRRTMSKNVADALTTELAPALNISHPIPTALEEVAA
jgi:hypothetical protein